MKKYIISLAIVILLGCGNYTDYKPASGIDYIPPSGTDRLTYTKLTIMNDRIDDLERTVSNQDKRINELEKELEGVKQDIALLSK